MGRLQIKNAIKYKKTYSNLVIGYHGYGNYGDDVLLLNYLDNCLVDCVVLVKKNISGVDKRHRQVVISNFHVCYLKSLLLVEKVVWVGGTCFYGGLKNQIFLLLSVSFARSFFREFVFYSVGVDSFSSSSAKLISHLSIWMSNRIYARDNSSYNYFLKINAQTLPYYDIFMLSKQDGPLAKVDRVVVNLSFRYICLREIDSLIELLSQKYRYITFTCLNSSDKSEVEFVDFIASNYRSNFISIHIHREVSATNSLFDESSGYLGYRLHGLGRSLISGLAVNSIAYQDKILKFCEEYCIDKNIIIQSPLDFNPMVVDNFEQKNCDFIPE